eukprot:scaffold39118_cov206-Skeletonema_marinoi.AAC.2
MKIEKRRVESVEKLKMGDARTRHAYDDSKRRQRDVIYRPIYQPHRFRVSPQAKYVIFYARNL